MHTSPQAMSLVHKSNGISHTHTLAAVYATKAKEVITGLLESEAGSALGVLAKRVVRQRW
jgi:hexaprenyl-diphosphate synthase